MGLKPDFLRVLAYAVMEHEKLQFTDAEMLLEKQDSSMFSICSPQIVDKTGNSSSVKLNGLPNKNPVPLVSEEVKEAQRPLHVHVNGFEKPTTDDKLSSSHSVPSLQYSSSSATLNDGYSFAASAFESAKKQVSSSLASPSCASNVQSTTRDPPGVSVTSGPLIPPSFASRREVEKARRKTVVAKIIRAKEANAFKFFVPSYASQTPTQLAVAARRHKSTAEDKIPRHIVTRVFGEEGTKIVKKRTRQAQCTRYKRYTNADDESTDLSDIEVMEKVDSVALKWSQVKASVSSELARNAMQIENAIRHAEDLGGFLCSDGQEPSCSSHEDFSCARIRPVGIRYTNSRRTCYSSQLRSENYRLSEMPYRSTGSGLLELSKDVPVWMNRDSISEEQRRCTAVQFDDVDDRDRLRAVPKPKRRRVMDRNPTILSTGTSSLEESEEERKDKSYTICGRTEKRRHEIRRARNRKKRRRRTRRLHGVESGSDTEESAGSHFRVKLEMPKYSDIEVPTWRKLSQEQVSELTDHRVPCGCCNSTRLETLVGRKHLRLAKQERLYFEGKRREMPNIDSDDDSEVEVDLSCLLSCSLTEYERAQYNRSAQFRSGREPSQRPR